MGEAKARPLTERLLMACVAGCDCGAKSPDIRWHDEMCHYRLFAEALGEIAGAKQRVLNAIREVHGKACDPTPLHKGIRMACSSISDKVEAI